MIRVSLIIPIYNEEDLLEQFLHDLDNFDLGYEKELVLINDCSTDSSADIVAGFSFRSRYQFIDQPTNRGKGAAIRLGIAKAKGAIIGIQDADFEYDIGDIPALLQPIIDDKADVTYGSRFKKSNIQVHRTYHYFVNRLLSMLSNLCSGLYLTDMETCYKFFKSDVIKNIQLESNRFGFEPEITAKIARLRVRVAEIPISYFPRSYLEGKKITWKDGLAAIYHIFYFNFIKARQRSVFDGLPDKYRTPWLKTQA